MKSAHESIFKYTDLYVYYIYMYIYIHIYVKMTIFDFDQLLQNRQNLTFMCS